MNMTFEEWWDKRYTPDALLCYGDAKAAWLAAQAQCAAGPWQDIKDAPKDGTPVLLACEVSPPDDYRTGWWDRNYKCWTTGFFELRPTHFAPLREVTT